MQGETKMEPEDLESYKREEMGGYQCPNCKEKYDREEQLVEEQTGIFYCKVCGHKYTQWA